MEHEHGWGDIDASAASDAESSLGGGQAPGAGTEIGVTPRRGFLSKLSAVVLGFIVGIVPAGAGLWVIAHPLLRRRSGNGPPFLKVTPLDSLPSDGTPRDYKVITDRQDAWTHHVEVPIGSVWLVRSAAKPDQVRAFNTTCPHLGCYVAAQADNTFLCPCHDSQFLADGSRGEKCVAARGLDELATRVEDGQVLVQFQDFETATDKKVAL